MAALCCRAWVRIKGLGRTRITVPTLFVTARAKAYPPMACETPALAGTEILAFVPERGCQRLYDLMQRRRG
jgi:hypothetical protein